MSRYARCADCNKLLKIAGVKFQAMPGDVCLCRDCAAIRDFAERRMEINSSRNELETRAEGHQSGCICADCSGAELTAKND